MLRNNAFKAAFYLHPRPCCVTNNQATRSPRAAMTPRRIRDIETLNPNDVKVHFSEQAHNAFADLEAATHFSDHFNPHILSIVQDFVNGENITVTDIFVALPSIAEETFRHIHATGDKRAAQAWREICEALPEEKGFTLTRKRVRANQFHRP